MTQNDLHAKSNARSSINARGTMNYFKTRKKHRNSQFYKKKPYDIITTTISPV